MGFVISICCMGPAETNHTDRRPKQIMIANREAGALGRSNELLRRRRSQ